MALERMDLREAGAVLGLTRNALTARLKAGKLDGQRDNNGKWWVMVDRQHAANDTPPRHANASDNDISTVTDNGTEKSALFAALTGHIDTLKTERDALRAEVARLQPRAELADKLQAQLDALQARLGDRAGEVEHLRAQIERMGEERQALLVDYLAKIDAKAENLPAERRSWFFRLWGKGKG